MKICSFGETLIDFTPVGVSENGNIIFERNPGGAPANLAAAAVKHGVEACFVGEVGDDIFGQFLQEKLRNQGVDTEYMIVNSRYKTTLAFVQLDEKGERSFWFYRNPGADTMIESQAVNLRAIDECDLFHYGSVSMTHNPARITTFELVKYAQQKGKILSFDPNLGMPLWNSEEEARHEIRHGLQFCDILKVAEDELIFLTGCETLEEGARQLAKKYKTPLILITEGEKGSHALIHGYYINAPTFPVSVVDTTGAGDGFLGCFLASFLKSGKTLEQLNGDDVYQMLRLANASGALSVTRKGGMPSLVTTEEAQALLDSQSES